EIQWSFGLTFAGDLLGVGAGVYLAQNYEPDPGFVSLLGTLHFTTFLAAGSIGSAFADELDQDTNRLISGTSLAIADVALAAAYYYRNEIDIDRNRVFWIDTGSMVGWIAGGGIGAIIAGTDQRAVSVGSTIGMATGIIATYWATRKTEDWRNRVDFENTANKGLHFETPSFSIRPRQRANGSQEYTYFVDLWGSF
ncbi:MAG: STMP1 family protein, partial [Gammaproteobacteria bacterium]|nr:STMP1 family protein [Gammaproteobacteria bacterium]